MLFKGKGSTHDPNNWRGICLKEMSAKIVSSIIATHLLAILKQHGCPNQFGHIGCQEALHTVHSILTLHRHHGHETYALFIDLVKAFDSFNHEILYAILVKFGIPKDLMKTIQKMYSDCTIHLQVGKEERESEYGTGVKQGDNMAPILSLFIMQAAYKMLQKRLTCEPFNFRHFPDNTKNPQNQNGCFASQNTSSNGKTFSVNSSFYVDDVIFLLATQHEAEQTAQLIYDHLDHFGLQMHVGSPKQRSETEAMFFPSTLAKQSNKPNQKTQHHVK